MTILIFSQEADAHVNSVTSILKEMCVPYVLFERYRRDHLINFVYKDGALKITLCINGDHYHLDDFFSVWWRVKPVISAEYPSAEGTLEEKYIVQEWRQLIAGMQYCISDSVIQINSRAVSEYISKIIQLKLAQECKLNIPHTCITNSSEFLRDNFFPENKQVIHKTLSSFFSLERAVYTTEVKIDEVIEDPDSITISPSIYQNRVNKSHELRVTIVGEEVFIAKVDSQSREETKLDWRIGDQTTLFSEGSLSEETTNRLLDFHRKSGLVYGAYDFIVNLDGKEIFLECNPNGQWLWLEDSLGKGISKAIANELSKQIRT